MLGQAGNQQDAESAERTGAVKAPPVFSRRLLSTASCIVDSCATRTTKPISVALVPSLCSRMPRAQPRRDGPLDSHPMSTPASDAAASRAAIASQKLAQFHVGDDYELVNIVGEGAYGIVW